MLLGLVLASAAPSAEAQTLPAGPRVFIDTRYVAPTGRTIAVAAGGDVQAALNTAQPGDVITLAAGATYTGNFTLPVKSGTGWITVRTSTPEGTLPAPGTRVSPANAGQMPKVVSTNSDPVVRTAAGAHHYRFIGIEFKTGAGHYIDTLIELGTGNDTSVTALPHDIIFDRCYVHGDPTVGSKRGIGLNGGATAVIDSYFADWKGQGEDTQAIAGWNGTGPFKLVNNYLEAAGENFIYGGADPKISNQVAADIEIRRNYFNKPVSWNLNNRATYAGKLWSVKNLLELKNARRVVVDGNLFEHVWEESQAGYAILLTPRNQEGTAPWSVVEDVTITNNIVRHAKAGVQFLGWDYDHPSQQLKRVLIKNNLFDDVGAPTWGTDGDGRLFQPEDGAAYVTIEHNTAFQTGAIIAAGGKPHTGWYYRNNLTLNGLYGVIGTGTSSGLNTLNTYFPGIVFAGNVIVGGDAGSYPAGNYFPASTSEVGFVNASGGNYRLSSTSPYRNAGTDGKDIGVDFAALDAAMMGTPTPIPAPAPLTVAIAQPAAGTTVSGAATVAVSAAGGGGGYRYAVHVDGTPVYSGTAATTVWNTTTVPNGTHTLTAAVTDAGGVSATASETAMVSNTLAPLTVAFTAPAAGATVTGTPTVAITAGGASPGPVTFAFAVDGAPLATLAQLGGAASYAWVTTRETNGSHVLSVTVTDGAGRTAVASETVKVANTTVAGVYAYMTSPYSGATVKGTITVQMSLRGGAGGVCGLSTFVLAVDGAVVSTQTLEGTAASYAWNTTTVPNGSHTLTLKVSDATGKSSATLTRKVIVSNP